MKSLCNGIFAVAVVCGLVLSVTEPATAQTEKVVYSFCSVDWWFCTDGAQPNGSLTKVKGLFFGTTEQGGANTGCSEIVYGCGTVFSVDPSNGVEKVLYSFCSQRNCRDGNDPLASLLEEKDILYGTTAFGGRSAGCSGGCGTVFAIDQKTGTERVVYSFAGGKDGANTHSSLIDVKGTLYGTTTFGGTYDDGTIFALSEKTGKERVLHVFGTGTNDGLQPLGGLIDVDGTLYGTTLAGGANLNNGTVIGLTLKTGMETVLYSFCAKLGCVDGSAPAANLIDVNGMLYGTTTGGGPDNAGTVFAINISTGIEKVLHAFKTAPDGDRPVDPLIDVKGILYGTTMDGGNYSGGIVFAVNAETGAERVAYSFCSLQYCADGAQPTGGLISANDTLYGITYTGGAVCCGTVFALTYPAGAFVEGTGKMPSSRYRNVIRASLGRRRTAG